MRPMFTAYLTFVFAGLAYCITDRDPATGELG